MRKLGHFCFAFEMFLVHQCLFYWVYPCVLPIFLYESQHLILFSWGISFPSIIPVHVVSFLRLNRMFYPFSCIKDVIWHSGWNPIKSLSGLSSILICCRMVIFAPTNWYWPPFHSDPFVGSYASCPVKSASRFLSNSWRPRSLFSGISAADARHGLHVPSEVLKRSPTCFSSLINPPMYFFSCGRMEPKLALFSCISWSCILFVIYSIYTFLFLCWSFNYNFSLYSMTIEGFI